jgi:hypothetical protein
MTNLFDKGIFCAKAQKKGRMSVFYVDRLREKMERRWTLKKETELSAYGPEKSWYVMYPTSSILNA